MVKAMAPPAPIGASFIITFIIAKKMCEHSSMNWCTARPLAPIRVRA